MRFVAATIILWGIAIATAVAVLGDTGRLTSVLPVFAICMIGSVVTVRRAANQRRGE